MTTKNKYNKTLLSNEAKQKLKDISFWMKVTSIIKFVFIGIAILSGLLTLFASLSLNLNSGPKMVGMFSAFSPSILIVSTLLQVVLYTVSVYIVLQAFQASQKFEAYVSFGQKNSLKEGFLKNKNYWKYSIMYMFFTIFVYGVILFIISSIIPFGLLRNLGGFPAF